MVTKEEKVDAAKIFFDHDAGRTLYTGKEGGSFTNGPAAVFALLAIAESEQDRKGRENTPKNVSTPKVVYPVDQSSKRKGASGSSVQVDMAKNGVSVEHILPRTSDAWVGWEDADKTTWLHRLGNMTIVHAVDNSKMGNKTFKQKMAILFPQGRDESDWSLYESSPGYKLTAMLKGLRDWTPKECKKRHDDIVKLLCHRWDLEQAASVSQSQAAPSNFGISDAAEAAAPPATGEMPTAAEASAAACQPAVHPATPAASQDHGPDTKMHRTGAIYAAWVKVKGASDWNLKISASSPVRSTTGDVQLLWPSQKKSMRFKWPSQQASNTTTYGKDQVVGHIRSKIDASNLQRGGSFDYLDEVKDFMFGFKYNEPANVEGSLVPMVPIGQTKQDAVRAAVKKGFSSPLKKQLDAKDLIDQMVAMNNGQQMLWLSATQRSLGTTRPKPSSFQSFLKCGHAAKKEKFFDELDPPCEFRPPDDPNGSQHAGGKAFGVIVRKVCFGNSPIFALVRGIVLGVSLACSLNGQMLPIFQCFRG